MRDNHLLWIAREFGNPEYVSLGRADLEVLARAVTTERYGAGARLYREGERPMPASSCGPVECASSERR